MWPGQNTPESAPSCMFIALFMAFVIYSLYVIVCVQIEEIPLRIPVAWDNVLLGGRRKGGKGEKREGRKEGVQV